jgi:hypothetical protein
MNLAIRLPRHPGCHTGECVGPGAADWSASSIDAPQALLNQESCVDGRPHTLIGKGDLGACVYHEGSYATS